MSDLMIRTKDRDLIPFHPNTVQEEYLDDLCPGWRENGFFASGLRELILKARQEGFSTLIAVLFFLDTINTANTTTVVIAHDKETTERMFQMLRRMYDNLPAHKKPAMRSLTKNEMIFDHNGSTYFIGTAGSDAFGRSSTINNLHCSEVAFWPNGETVATGLFQAVASSGNIFIESTANGIGNFFYEEYWKADAGDSTFKARFFAWFRMKEYRAHPLIVKQFTTVADIDLEAKIRKAYDLDDEQLAYRRHKMREPGMWVKFVQEYPSNPEEAFVASGNPYFDRETLGSLINVLRGGRYPAIEDVDFGPYDRLALSYARGDLVIYDLPVEGETYVLGADTAEGITQAGRSDYCSADVLHAKTGAQVAHLHGKWDTREYAMILDELARFFCMALLAPERNNHGHAVISTLMHECEYPNLYEHEEYDSKTASSARKPGWPTSVKSKTLMLDTLASDLLSGDVRIKNAETVREMMTFVKKPGGKAGGEGASHDDCVISIAVANIIAKDNQVEIIIVPSIKQSILDIDPAKPSPIGTSLYDMIKRRG